MLANQIPKSASQIQMLSYVQASLPGCLLNVFTCGSMFYTKHANQVSSYFMFVTTRLMNQCLLYAVSVAFPWVVLSVSCGQVSFC